MAELMATRVFYENKNCKKPIVVNRGGARSSKSHSLMQLFCNWFFSGRKRKLFICRKTSPSLRISVLQKFYEVCREFGVEPTLLRGERNVLNFYYGSNILHFGAIDDPEKIKSTEWNKIWMEETNEFDLEDMRTLKLRLSASTPEDDPNQLFMSFNPIDVYHWIKEKVVDVNKGAEEIVSTYKDNPFLDKRYVEEELLPLQEQDPNYYNIYVLGQWGRLENLIYPTTSWRVVSAFDWPKDFDEVIYGLDFGFTNSQTGLIEIGFKADEIFEREVLYASGLTNADLICFMNEGLQYKDAPIYADAAEPMRIEEINREGFNIYATEKKQGSVLAGIDFVKRQKVNIHESSTNLISEKRSYSWRKDKSGHVIDQPVKAHDHLMDAERGAMFSHGAVGVPGIWVM